MGKSLWIIPALAGIFGVIIGAITVYLFLIKQEQMYLKMQMEGRRDNRKVNTRNILLHLNGKLNEIIMNRQKQIPTYIGFDSFSDLFINIDDYVYLQSYIAQNFDFLPDYVRIKFMKDLTSRKVILNPEETIDIGGYAFKGGRLILERLSEDILETIENEYTQRRTKKEA